MSGYGRITLAEARDERTRARILASQCLRHTAPRYSLAVYSNGVVPMQGPKVSTRSTSLSIGIVLSLVSAAACAQGSVTLYGIVDTAIELADTGLLGFERSTVGTPKNSALAALLEKSISSCRIRNRRSSASSGVSPSIAVLCANHPLAMADFEAEGLKPNSATLAIELGVESSRVSPVMVAGSTPCLDCRNLNECKIDESWAAISSQLRFRKERLDDSQTSLLCAGFALEVLVRHLDARKPVTFEGKGIDHRTGLVRLESWKSSTECGC